MRLPSGMWLWFCLASVAQAGPASRWHQQHEGDVSYKFVQLWNSFWGAQAWCQANGGCLACTWNPEMQALLSHRPVEGEKWWISLRKHPCEKNPGEGEGSWDLLPLSVLGGGLWGLILGLPCPLPCHSRGWPAPAVLRGGSQSLCAPPVRAYAAGLTAAPGFHGDVRTARSRSADSGSRASAIRSCADLWSWLAPGFQSSSSCLRQSTAHLASFCG